MSDHLKFVVPGAILSAVAAFMLFYGWIFYMITRLSGGSGSMMGSVATTLIVLGICFLCIGLPLIFKGVKVYRASSISTYKYNRPPAQPIAYTPSPAPSYNPNYAPSYSPSYTPAPTPTPSAIQDPTPPKETLAPEKKYCPSCGAELPKGSQAHFCPSCGGAI